MVKPECAKCAAYSNHFRAEINPFETVLCSDCPDRATMWTRMERAHASVPHKRSERLQRLATATGYF